MPTASFSVGRGIWGWEEGLRVCSSGVPLQYVHTAKPKTSPPSLSLRLEWPRRRINCRLRKTNASDPIGESQTSYGNFCDSAKRFTPPPTNLPNLVNEKRCSSLSKEKKNKKPAKPSPSTYASPFFFPCTIRTNNV